MSSKSSGPPAPRLAGIRARWLSAATAALHDDPLVVGAALVGSLGTGRADDWSDVDLLIVVEDAHLNDYAIPGRLPNGPGRPAFAIDARHNGPRGTRAVSAQYVVEGLPLWVDWHIHPVSLASWPSDSNVIFDRRDISRISVTFSEYVNSGQHESATPKSADDQQAMRLALVPIAGKQLARRSPETARTIEFLGGTYAQDGDWKDHLAALRQLLDRFATLGLTDSHSAGQAYIEFLEKTLR
ncbi:nucleotidyltransferase domain-containing protein [Kribbella sp. NBC_01245]|uniref:nucleotidyltransferase domain-containing protein n=1 Tax=Kribbella sp. NBC_01245 TaxID=2903578 RepID=UPI002E2BF92C|nr:nucleotidyltransferase domain-containing protein [Kribbella sp. NBC_01245]